MIGSLQYSTLFPLIWQTEEESMTQNRMAFLTFDVNIVALCSSVLKEWVWWFETNETQGNQHSLINSFIVEKIMIIRFIVVEGLVLFEFLSLYTLMTCSFLF